MSSLVSDSYMMEISLDKQDGKLIWKGFIPVDSLEHVSVSIVSPDAKYMDLQILNFDDEPTGQPITAEISESWMGYEKQSSVPAKIYKFTKVDQIRIGDWFVQVSLNKQTAPQAIIEKYLTKDASSTDAMLMIYNSSPLTAHTQSLSFKTLVGDKIGFITRVSEKSEVEKRATLGVQYIPQAIPLASFEHIEAEMDVILPDGHATVIPMRDAVSSGRFAVDPKLHQDGTFSGEFVATEKGIFHFTVLVKGVVSEEMKARLFANAKMVPSQQKITFMRTTQHIISVVEKDLELVNAGTVAAFNQMDEMMTVNLQAKPLVQDAEPKKYKAYAEIWARSQDGSSIVPVCWSLGMSISNPSTQGKDLMSIPLQFSMKWLSKANAQLPLTLKNVKIQDVDSSTIISEIAEISQVSTHHEHVDEITKMVKRRVTDQEAVHKFAKLLLNSVYAFNKGDQVTEMMTLGPRPKDLIMQPMTTKRGITSGHKVILVHGYCSGGNPFTASDFQNAVIFSDIKQSRTNDQFAQLIWQIGKDLPSFSIVSHSQGGLAAVHLYTFYWSKADNVPTNPNIRILQSVGSPYGGCSAAGSIANLGKVFGAGCGSNSDLSVDGASKWLKTIPESSQKKIYYYATQNPDGGKSCQSVMDWVLYKPNDGTVEIRFTTSFAAANNMGITKGWCHTADMAYPAQGTDHDRNAVLNKYANGF
ncbi:hypothetical protein C9374_006885 [Naegleria lovaniensis]|uniref:Conditioned medium factor n=1 Tax=Naegleria lovaniensis TaxID=51637 RepID=A0AA88KS66_NAELO|nr:uncharacterized protein C9374_006885 [Naegleria lovaniensis]KAG2393354.1 hypothetical protein C9374_006885 [Naegleria lovaniensis]